MISSKGHNALLFCGLWKHSRKPSPPGQLSAWKDGVRPVTDRQLASAHSKSENMATNKQAQPPAEKELWSTPWPVGRQPLQLELGDLSLVITRLSHEWQLAYQWSRRGNSGGFSCAYREAAPEYDGSLDRIAMESMTDTLTLQPALADRPVVVRPYSAMTIPGRNRITLYVSTPLWLIVEFSPDVRKELPMQQLSETWMGSVTGQGELCYGSHTHARLDKQLLLKRPFRALSPITIHNKNVESLTLERLSIPTPFLSLYEAVDQLITEPVTIAMDSEKHQGVVEIGRITDLPLLVSPRNRADRGILVSAWENLFA